jgi:putative FmdB family regulatory protein
MPTYTYQCSKCNNLFELFSYIKDYQEHPKCLNCKSKETSRFYEIDMLTISGSVKKSDSELKTIGDLAKRNSDRMSDDEKHHLYLKHNSYKEDPNPKELPSGMSRIKKTNQKIKWPGSTGIKPKRKKL